MTRVTEEQVLAVECPRCKAQAGRRCRGRAERGYPSSTKPLMTLHRERRTAVLAAKVPA